MNKKKMGLWLVLTTALFLLSLSVTSKEANAAKLVHGVQTTYQKFVSPIGYQDVATQFENTSFDTILNGKPPYPGLIPSPTAPVKVIKTAYISLTETGNYMFAPMLGQVYVNDTLVNTSGQPTRTIYLQAGQIIKVKYDTTFTTLNQNAQLLWRTPSMGFSPVQFIPQELLYTTPDLQGIDVDAPTKLVHGVQTTYQKFVNPIGYQDVASQFENTSFDTALNGKPPYPGLIPSPTTPVRVIKTAYLNLTETGTYQFLGVTGQVYINDTLLNNLSSTIYLQAGQIIKIKFVVTFTSLTQNSQLLWRTPSTGFTQMPTFIPQELLYTTPDLQGVDL